MESCKPAPDAFSVISEVAALWTSTFSWGGVRCHSIQKLDLLDTVSSIVVWLSDQNGGLLCYPAWLVLLALLRFGLARRRMFTGTFRPMFMLMFRTMFGTLFGTTFAGLEVSIYSLRHALSCCSLCRRWRNRPRDAFWVR